MYLILKELNLKKLALTPKGKADLHLLVADVGQVAAVGGLGRVLRVDVKILQHDGLAEGGLVVDPGTSLAVAAGADLEVEGAIDLVLLGTEDGGQVLRHPEAELFSLLTFLIFRLTADEYLRFTGNICDQLSGKNIQQILIKYLTVSQ